MSEIGAAQVTRRSGPSIVWLVPLITALVGGWLIFRTLSDQAPVATISFQTAEGIEAGKTKIRYKSVEIGIVEEVSFAEDFENVILTARFNEGMDNFLRRNTRFWVVRPQLSVQGVSGLSTLVSGSYIEIDPGPGSAQNHFVGLEQMPLITTEDAGTRITLASESLNSIARGSITRAFSLARPSAMNWRATREVSTSMPSFGTLMTNWYGVIPGSGMRAAWMSPWVRTASKCARPRSSR